MESESPVHDARVPGARRAFVRPARPIVILAAVLVATLIRAEAPAAAPAPTTRDEIVVYAAVSLRDALAEIAPLCEPAAGARIVFNLGASNELARQIVAANQADVFVSADEAWMDRVAAAGLVDPATRRDLVSNRLVVIVPADSRLAIDGAAALGRAPLDWLSLANPEAVPAGKYAKAWLQKSGVWAKLSDRILPAADARAALAAVESGGAAAGIVYATDAAISKKVRVVYRVSEDESGARIAYPIAAMRDRPLAAKAKLVVDCFAGDAARAVFERRGFVLLPRP